MIVLTFRRACTLLVGFILAGAMAVAQAEALSFTVPLTGGQEVPPVQSQGSGTAKLSYDASTRVLRWNVTFSDLSSEATMAHFHGPAPVGKNADVKIWISPKGTMSAQSPLVGYATLSPEEAQMFEAGMMYINVHTKTNPSGEIRGQVVPPKG